MMKASHAGCVRSQEVMMKPRARRMRAIPGSNDEAQGHAGCVRSQEEIEVEAEGFCLPNRATGL
jgi:hypothetical protein